MTSVTISRHTLQQLIDAAEYAAEQHEEHATYGPEPGMTREDHAAFCAEYTEAARAARTALGIDPD